MTSASGGRADRRASLRVTNSSSRFPGSTLFSLPLRSCWYSFRLGPPAHTCSRPRSPGLGAQLHARGRARPPRAPNREKKSTTTHTGGSLCWWRRGALEGTSLGRCSTLARVHVLPRNASGESLYNLPHLRRFAACVAARSPYLSFIRRTPSPSNDFAKRRKAHASSQLEAKPKLTRTIPGMSSSPRTSSHSRREVTAAASESEMATPARLAAAPWLQKQPERMLSLFERH